MSKTAIVRARIEPSVKNGAERVFRRLGVSTTQAISMFYKQVDIRQGLPFEVAIPNKKTRHTLKLTDSGRDVVLCKNADDMFRKLGL